MSTMQHWTRVIVLTPPGAESASIAGAWKAEFAARDWYAIQHDDPYLAMAELCLRERSQAARSSWGLQRIELIALVLVEPSGWMTHEIDISRLISAMKHYLPDASIWEATDTRLNLIHGEAQNEPDIAPPQIVVPQRQIAPAAHSTFDGLRLIDVDKTHTSAAASALSHQTSTALASLDETPDEDLAANRTRITRQEIEMLLNGSIPMPESEAS